MWLVQECYSGITPTGGPLLDHTSSPDRGAPVSRPWYYHPLFHWWRGIWWVGNIEHGYYGAASVEGARLVVLPWAVQVPFCSGLSRSESGDEEGFQIVGTYIELCWGGVNIWGPIWGSGKSWTHGQNPKWRHGTTGWAPWVKYTRIIPQLSYGGLGVLLQLKWQYLHMTVLRVGIIMRHIGEALVETFFPALLGWGGVGSIPTSRKS